MTPNPPWQEAVGELKSRLARSRKLTVVTGAGISAASGVPTFRGEGGLWRQYRATDLATPEAFRQDPQLVWEFYAWRRELVSQCHPNPAHLAVAAWSRRQPEFTCITQNVDGLHEAAGTRNVVRFHGSLWEMQCAEACRDAPSSWEDRREPLPEMPPRCPYCRGLLRPGVVWFGEAIPSAALQAAQQAVLCDLMVVIGTASQVYPAASLVDAAATHGAYTVEINAETTPATSRVNLALTGPAEQILADL
ncbi:MAG: NAD-dependent deacylase [Planctomycetota bacterium]|nr:MAG: NAD-dependent deacylase [Planctomycetota bacterium]